MARIDRTLFKAYDVRSTVDKLTPQAAYLIGRAAGTMAVRAGHKRFSVGRDGRLSSPELAAQLIRGLQECGLQVLDLGLAATPMMYFAALYRTDGCGAVVTGSHNPPNYNGIKIMDGGVTVGDEKLASLADLIEAEDFATGTGSVAALDITPDYLTGLCAQNQLKRPLNVVIDCGNGVTGAMAPELYKMLGCNVTGLFTEVDGHFPNHHPDPQVAANLVDLQAEVARSGADVGLAFDGDGDRLGVVTKSGRIVPGDKILMLFAKAELDKQPGGHILYDVKSSRAVSVWVQQLGGTSEAIATGHTHMKKRLKETNALVAGELSGHLAFGQWKFDDGMYAGARILQMIAAGTDLDALLDSMPQFVSSPEIQVPVSEDGHAVVARIAQSATFPTSTSLITIDGLRIEYADGFGLIRASNTTPVLTLRLEAENDAALARIRGEVKTAIAPLPWPEH
ncbi:phosphomannomutase/phosphoglucomutase [Silvimonas sp.]|uniref:phosphomannomutase/phosphoglucomutase n=1 Tax=Silvimonas sp. TaxID=2650811 RepID=UPI00285123EF|nr:phosphomannomutase/phosphoglucomutase [Silvimonas sp.]MDR3427926.1 phosphomannomutase/phosphoglucomutase [Silvimonas sp.]